MKDPSYKAHVAPAKKKVVQELVKLFEEYPIVGAVDVENLPAQQFQEMRDKFRKNMKIIMAKKRVIRVALDAVKDKRPGIENLKDKLDGMPALIFTKDNPFKLYKNLNSNKSPAPAKGGQKAPKNIVVPAGPTSFAPGPIIGQLGGFGIKAGIEGGKIAIKADSVVAKEGDIISPALAEILTRLDIKPMEIGLNLVAAYENGDVFMKNVLAIDDAQFLADVSQCGSWAFNLAMFAAVPNKDTVEHLLAKAYRETRAVAVSEALPIADVMEDIIGRAHLCAQAVKSAANV